MLPPVLDTRNDQGCRCFVWQIEIDDGRHPVDIDAAGGNVGGDGVGRSAPRAVSTSAPKFARLFAGGRWIRTIGTCKISYRFETDIRRSLAERDSFACTSSTSISR